MKVIEVIPNPYIALDKDGVPQGAVGAGMPGLYIGAQVDLLASRKTGKLRFFYPVDAKAEAKAKGTGLRRRVHLNNDIVTSVLAGELIVCTKEDAAACGLSLKEFLEPEKALEIEKKKALDYWQALKGGVKGPDTSAKIGEIPREATVEKTGETIPLETASKEVSPNLKMTKVEV